MVRPISPQLIVAHECLTLGCIEVVQEALYHLFSIITCHSLTVLAISSIPMNSSGNQLLPENQREVFIRELTVR